MEINEIQPCFVCSEAFRDDSLIHMQTNSLIIGASYIDFQELVWDLTQLRIDDQHQDCFICIGCKDQLTEFYVMKQRIKEQHMKPEDIRKSQITNFVANFINQSSDVDYVVTKCQNFLAIHPDVNNQTFQDQLHLCSSLLDGESQCEPQNIELEEHEEDENDNEISLDKPKQEEETFFEIIEEEVKDDEDQAIIIEEVKPKKTRRSFAKLTDLDQQQRDWIKREVRDNMVLLETSMGNKMRWCCNQCPYKSFSSEYAFRIHLKKHHINEFKESKKRPLNADDHSFIEQKLWIQQQLQSRKEIAESSEGGKLVWSCNECEFTCNKRSRFRLHLQKAHTTILMKGPNKHSCLDCHLRFDGENHLMVHKNCHKIFNVIAPYSSFPHCESCKMYFCTDEDLKTHILRHQEDPSLIREPIPAAGVVLRNGEAFVSEEEEMEILNDDSSVCGHCLLKFPTEDACKIHLMLFHLTVFTCPFDSREFSGIPTLSFGNHLRQSHPTIFHEIEIACSFCKMQFDTVYEKLAHMKKCTAKTYQCDHCEKSFFRKNELQHHLKVALGLMIFACHFCGKRCKDQGDLKTHIRTHTNDRPYPCPHCDRAYKTSSARASHVESHMEQTHACDICNVKFRRRILYQRHMKLIHDEAYRQKCFAENTCSICKKSYLRKTHFKNHLKTHQAN